MTEDKFRSAIRAEAMAWIGTPYHPCGKLKGVGVNCSQFAFQVALASGVLPADAPNPRWYTPQLATHSKEERLIAYVESYGAREISEREAKTGDIVLFRSGHAHGHMAIVLDWPQIIHVLPPHGCQMGSVDEGRLGGMSRKCFTLWKE